MTKSLLASAWLVGGAVAMSSLPNTAYAWGDEGHKLVALIALKFLDPGPLAKVNLLLAQDKDTLTATDFASRATWADRYRDSDRNTTQKRYLATRQWHFVDIEVDAPDADAACFGHPAVPAGRASTGPANDCVTDKINQFAAELKAPGTSQAERRLAFKFLLHFVGDVHQPLHSADEHDLGGNNKRVLPPGTRTSVTLHGYWDNNVIAGIEHDDGKKGTALASDLAMRFQARKAAWMSARPEDWAMESFAKAKSDAYNLPQQTVRDNKRQPASPLSAAYEQAAKDDGREQVVKAGMRLALVLNEALR